MRTGVSYRSPERLTESVQVAVILPLVRITGNLLQPSFY